MASAASLNNAATMLLDGVLQCITDYAARATAGASHEELAVRRTAIHELLDCYLDAHAIAMDRLREQEGYPKRPQNRPER